MGKETLGRIINVIGEPVDEQGPVSESFPLSLRCTLYILLQIVKSIGRATPGSGEA